MLRCAERVAEKSRGGADAHSTPSPGPLQTQQGPGSRKAQCAPSQQPAGHRAEWPTRELLTGEVSQWPSFITAFHWGCAQHRESVHLTGTH